MELEGLKGWGAQQVHPHAASALSVFPVLEQCHVCSMPHLNGFSSAREWRCQDLGQRVRVALFLVCRCDCS